jgi:hypothetical protein
MTNYFVLFLLSVHSEQKAAYLPTAPDKANVPKRVILRIADWALHLFKQRMDIESTEYPVDREFLGVDHALYIEAVKEEIDSNASLFEPRVFHELLSAHFNHLLQFVEGKVK